MAKTIMIRDAIYEDLKSIKEREGKSYSEVIDRLLESKKKKTLGEAMKSFGVLKDDKEYEEVMKESKKAWARWTKRYV